MSILSILTRQRNFYNSNTLYSRYIFQNSFNRLHMGMVCMPSFFSHLAISEPIFICSVFYYIEFVKNINNIYSNQFWNSNGICIVLNVALHMDGWFLVIIYIYQMQFGCFNLYDQLSDYVMRQMDLFSAFPALKQQSIGIVNIVAALT